jgi:nicotinamidase-related amidase
MLMRRERAVLVVVDLQVKLQPAIHKGGRVLKEALRLIRVARALGVPVLGTEHCAKAIGPLLPEVRELCDRVVGKTRFGAAAEPEFLEALPLGRDEFLVCGTEAHVCVLQTALGLAQGGGQAGRTVRLACDAIGSRDAASVEAAIGRAGMSGVPSVTVEMAAFEWTADARDPAFREVLRLVK